MMVADTLLEQFSLWDQLPSAWKKLLDQDEINKVEEAIGNNDLNEESQVSFQDPSMKRYFNSIARTSKV